MSRSTTATVLPRSTAPAALTALTALAALVLLLVGVGAAAPAQAADGSGVPPGKAWVRAGHFVPGMGATTITLTPQGTSGATTLAQQATYGDVSPYAKLAPGTYTAVVREDSAPAGADPVLSRSLEVTAGQARTVAVIGTAEAPRLVLLTDDLTPPAAGTARVRVLSAAESAGALTVSAVDGPTIATDAVLGQASDYTTVPAGSWTLQLQDDADTRRQPVPIVSGSIYTVVALDSADSAGGVELQVVTDAAGAVTAPVGGAKTGEGGTAASTSATAASTTTGSGLAGVPLLSALGGLVAALLVLAAGARRLGAGR